MGLFNKDKWVQVIVCGICGYPNEVKGNLRKNRECRACREGFEFYEHIGFGSFEFGPGGSKIKYGKKNKQGIWYFRDDS